MKKSIKILVVILSITLIHSCKKDKVPTLTTTEVTNILATSATSGGTITDEGSGIVNERGICWSKGTTPTITDSKTVEGGGVSNFISNMTNLEGATSYYVRAYAKNAAGIGYGMAMSFKTLGLVPLVAVLDATNITVTTSTLNGSVNANYLNTTVTFEYGLTNTYGQSIPAVGNSLSGNLNSSVSAEISELNPGTTYHFRIKAENSLGIAYTEDMSFTTLGQVPTAVTQAACCLSTTGAKLNGTVNANFVTSFVTFEFGLTTEYGNSVTATESPVTGNNYISVSANISGLTPGTTYNFRVKAENSLGTTYGNDMEFTTLLPQITDIDGNIYNTVIIGTQLWMRENLKTTRYNNGDDIPEIEDNLSWSEQTSGAYCWYNNAESINKDTYGALYNAYTVADNRNVCPVGWHVPSDEEWTVLTDYLNNNDYGYNGTSYLIGKSLAATSGWIANSIAGTVGNDQASNNKSGFSALPGGVRIINGNFGSIGYSCGLLSSSVNLSGYGHALTLAGEFGTATIQIPLIKDGLSVRCLKDY